MTSLYIPQASCDSLERQWFPIGPYQGFCRSDGRHKIFKVEELSNFTFFFHEGNLVSRELPFYTSLSVKKKNSWHCSTQLVKNSSIRGALVYIDYLQWLWGLMMLGLKEPVSHKGGGGMHFWTESITRRLIHRHQACLHSLHVAVGDTQVEFLKNHFIIKTYGIWQVRWQINHLGKKNTIITT